MKPIFEYGLLVLVIIIAGLVYFKPVEPKQTKKAANNGNWTTEPEGDFYGTEAGHSGITGFDNVAVGYKAEIKNTTTSDGKIPNGIVVKPGDVINGVAIGYKGEGDQSMFTKLAGSQYVAIGYKVMIDTNEEIPSWAYAIDSRKNNIMPGTGCELKRTKNK